MMKSLMPLALVFRIAICLLCIMLFPSFAAIGQSIPRTFPSYYLEFTPIDSPSYVAVHAEEGVRDTVQDQDASQRNAAADQDVGFLERLPENDRVLWRVTLVNGTKQSIYTQPQQGISDYVFEHFHPLEELIVFRIIQYEGGGVMLFRPKKG